MSWVLYGPRRINDLGTSVARPFKTDFDTTEGTAELELLDNILNTELLPQTELQFCFWTLNAGSLISR